MHPDQWQMIPRFPKSVTVIGHCECTDSKSCSCVASLSPGDKPMWHFTKWIIKRALSDNIKIFTCAQKAFHFSLPVLKKYSIYTYIQWGIKIISPSFICNSEKLATILKSINERTVNKHSGSQSVASDRAFQQHLGPCWKCKFLGHATSPQLKTLKVRSSI